MHPTTSTIEQMRSTQAAMSLLSRAVPEQTLDESDVEGLILALHALAKVDEPAVIGVVGEALLRQEIMRFVWWPCGGARFIRSVLTLGSVSREFVLMSLQYVSSLFPELDDFVEDQFTRLEANEDTVTAAESVRIAVGVIYGVEDRAEDFGPALKSGRT